MMLNMTATGTALPTIESLIVLFPRTIEQNVGIDLLPRLRHVQNLRVVLQVLGEAVGALQLSEFDTWDQLFAGAATTQRLRVQGLITSACDRKSDVTTKAVLGGLGVAGTVLQNGGQQKQHAMQSNQLH